MTRQESKHVALVSICYRYINKRLCQIVTYSTLMQYSMLFHSNSGCMKAPQCYVIRTLTVLLCSRVAINCSSYPEHTRILKCQHLPANRSKYFQHIYSQQIHQPLFHSYTPTSNHTKDAYNNNFIILPHVSVSHRTIFRDAKQNPKLCITHTIVVLWRNIPNRAQAASLSRFLDHAHNYTSNRQNCRSQ